VRACLGPAEFSGVQRQYHSLLARVRDRDCVEGKPVSYNPRDMKPEPNKQYGRSMERPMDSIGSSSPGYPRHPFYCSFIAGKSI